MVRSILQDVVGLIIHLKNDERESLWPCDAEPNAEPPFLVHAHGIHIVLQIHNEL
jgi:hypothetical protein